MTWVAHDPHKHAKDSRPFYTYICKDAKGEDYYAAYIVHNDIGFKATVPSVTVQPRGKETLDYHYTHDTLQDAKDWCIAELWKRRLDQ
jgi:hypothetical protein